MTTQACPGVPHPTQAGVRSYQVASFPKPYALKPKTLASIQEYSLNYIGTGLRYSKPYSNYCGSKFLKKL